MGEGAIRGDCKMLGAEGRLPGMRGEGRQVGQAGLNAQVVMGRGVGLP